MTILLTKHNVKEDVEMKNVYCQTLIELARKNNQIVVLDADLMSSMGMIPFLEAFPFRRGLLIVVYRKQI